MPLPQQGPEFPHSPAFRSGKGFLWAAPAELWSESEEGRKHRGERLWQEPWTGDVIFRTPTFHRAGDATDERCQESWIFLELNQVTSAGKH